MSPKLTESPVPTTVGVTLPRSRRSAHLACLSAGLIVVILGSLCLWSRSVPVVSGRLPQQAYVWQRQWTTQVRAAIVDAGPLSGMCVSYAEIRVGAGESPAVERTAGIDYALLARTRQPIGFAVRVHDFAGEVSVAREPFPTLRALVAELCRTAALAGLRPAEIEVDFDCPTSRLRGFTGWLRELRQLFPEQTFRFTALPAWLRSRDFAPLAQTTGGYILQLHWLARPGIDGRPPVTLCDPVQARAAVERAARVGVPFRVALPTYGYRLILDARGKLLAAAAEESPLESARPPPGGTSRTLRADPAAMTDLITAWQARRPSALQGVIWYRLPVAGDRLNWEPATFRAVIAGRHPQPKLVVQFVSAPADGPCELRLCNAGDGDATLPASIAIHCASVPTSADGVGGFDLEQNNVFKPELTFTPRSIPGEPLRILPAGKSILFGWVRLAGFAAAEPMEAQLSGSIAPAQSVPAPE